jgi:hypothetical protein
LGWNGVGFGAFKHDWVGVDGTLIISWEIGSEWCSCLRRGAVLATIGSWRRFVNRLAHSLFGLVFGLQLWRYFNSDRKLQAAKLQGFNTASCKLQAAGCRLQAAGCRLQAARRASLC